VRVLGKSHFPIDLGILTAIRQLIPKGSTIVELGSGNGTNRLTKEFTVFSIEDDERWIGYCEGTNYIHAPLIESVQNEQSISWYDSEKILAEMPEEYDLILVDGPSGKKGRSGLLANLDMFRKDVPFVIDDTLREHECQVAREMAFMLNRPLYMFWNFSIISPHFLTVEQIARIQKAALQVLETEEDGYLKSYFSETNTLVGSNFDKIDEVLVNINQDRLKRFSLEANQRKLNLIEKSFSLRLGKSLTFPLRLISKIVNGDKKKES